MLLELIQNVILLHPHLNLGKSFLCPFDNANREDAYNTAANTQGPVH